jgi:serine/threonine protein kinase/Tol biopolymer transport system component/tetratricopeptide (TPR) repeat protein
MTSERWKEVKELFASALEQDAGKRAAFLDEVCRGDQGLRHEVESLLASHQEAGDFIEKPAVSTDTFLPGAGEEEEADIGRRIGAYRTVKEIGRGGMGSVYLAVRDDDEFERRVAIKLIRRGMEIDFIVRRFRNERQILANLDHPYIARLLDGGTTEDGLPYFVMEYVEGRPVHRYCEDQQLPVSDRLKLFEKVCEAVAYAHDHQVIHRDLKPGNILVTADGAPKLLDFGIAKLLDPDVPAHSAEPTTAGFRMMTPAYASPEQLHGQPATAASDVYSLGVLLCEVLTGRRPERYGAGGSAHVTSAILTGGLENILAKAMREEPGERYLSVGDLAADVRRHLAGQPVSAGPYSAPSVHTGQEADRSTGPKSIAVLPFQSLGAADKSDEYLGVGMADALITKLSNIRRMVVRPTSSVLRYAQGDHDLVAAARALDVHYVLDGRIRRVGDRIRITVQLVRGRDGAPLWAAKFDEKFTDILNIEDSLSEQLAQAIIHRLTEEERDLLHKRGTDNAQAYQLYLKGRFYWSSSTEEGLSKSLLAFTEALTLDPNFALAQAGIADYYNWLGVWNMLPPAECFAAAKDAAIKALKLDPTLAEAHNSLAFATWTHDRDWNAAERGFERAIQLNPDYATAHQWYSYMASTRGRHDEAIERIERAQRLDPLSPVLGATAAFVYYNAGLFDRGIEELKRAARIDPRQYMVQQGFAWFYTQKGMYGEAVAAAEKALAISPDNPLLLWTMATSLAAAGRPSEARAMNARMMELSETRYVSPFYFAVTYAVLGETEAALDWLEKAYEMGDWWLVWMAVEHRLASVRLHPRFKRLEERIGLSGADAACCPPGGLTPVGAPAPVATPTARTSSDRPRLSRWAVYAVGILSAFIALATIGKFVTSRNETPFQELKIVKLRTNGNAISTSISPDGKYIAYTLVEGGNQGIWIRQVANEASVNVVRPANFVYGGLAFSHDGAYLYYSAHERNNFEHGTLYQVPVLGGPQRKLISDVQSAVTLSPDGKQVAFLRNSRAEARDELILANVDSGAERRLSSRKHPAKFGFASAPAWRPDGAVVTVAHEDADAQGRYTSLANIDVSTGALKVLPSQRWQFIERMVWLPNGSTLLVIGQDPESTFQQVWAVPARGGKPRKITNDLNDYVGLSIAADSRHLITRQFQVLTSIWIAPKGDMKGAEQLTPGAGRYYDLAWTPDGKIMYSADASDTVDLWARDPDGSAPKQLTSGARRNYSPAATPDGRHILFHTNRTGTWNIWRMDRDGGNQHPVTADSKIDSNWPQASADGRWVIFHRPAPGGGFHIWKTSIEGGEPVEMSQEICMRPAVSPRDGTIACWYSEAGPKPVWRIGVFPPGGGRPSKDFAFPTTVSVDSALRWSPDGRAVAYVDNRGGISNIWSQPLDGSPPHLVTDFHGGEIYSFAWSRNGNLAISRGMHTSDLVLISDVR